jgi:hypothetical protein
MVTQAPALQLQPQLITQVSSPTRYNPIPMVTQAPALQLQPQLITQVSSSQI